MDLGVVFLVCADVEDRALVQAEEVAPEMVYMVYVKVKVFVEVLEVAVQVLEVVMREEGVEGTQIGWEGH
ncbi:hypothetical protein GLAREA_02093 [Glarea lozoyensis ATCC 20868]|uniref:Uncharacterized protein n=1 Tax=Glarea lozoyensis (strain ATCC 20868 / MF5171) TaxID=1116229 RepID=S3D2A7_GLAL2|nr:uncharacterized protein GLAREA_02093 [Glarea lozoyensis ATCC 20868]EPE26181.1 hypothetical protein GLAREA_02093 [Glarea lozoyensis ATCC 20868]